MPEGSPPPSSTPLTIRTMQDDVREARLPKSAGTPGRSAPVAPAVPSTPVVPLPPKGDATQKVVMKPPRRRRGRSRLIPVLILALLLILAGSGGLIWWFLKGAAFTAPTAAAPVAEVIPAASAVVVQYHLADAAARGNLVSAWNSARSEQPSLTSLLAGDPRLLLNEADLDTFYYVMLEDDVRPYLLVPQNSRTKELLAASSEAHATELKGWYVLSAVATDNYSAAVARGTRTAPLFAQGEDQPLRLWLGPQALNNLREGALGADLSIGRLQELELGAAPEGTTMALALKGQGRSLQAVPAAVQGDAYRPLLAAIPAEAAYIHLGSNFSQDIAQWGPLTAGIDMDVLGRSNVSSLLRQLSGPYAFYAVSNNPATRDLGLIITLPTALEASLTAPGSALEESLQALLPLLTGRKGLAGSAISFNPNTHAGLPLAYANFSQPSQALDYAVAGHYLVISTSREGMFSLLETLTQAHPAAPTSPRWQPLLSAWGALPAGASLDLGRFVPAQFLHLLPLAADKPPVFGVAATPIQTGQETAVAGLLLSGEKP